MGRQAGRQRQRSSGGGRQIHSVAPARLTQAWPIGEHHSPVTGLVRSVSQIPFTTPRQRLIRRAFSSVAHVAGISSAAQDRQGRRGRGGEPNDRAQWG